MKKKETDAEISLYDSVKHFVCETFEAAVVSRRMYGEPSGWNITQVSFTKKMQKLYKHLIATLISG